MGSLSSSSSWRMRRPPAWGDSRASSRSMLSLCSGHAGIGSEEQVKQTVGDVLIQRSDDAGGTNPKKNQKTCRVQRRLDTDRYRVQ